MSLSTVLAQRTQTRPGIGSSSPLSKQLPASTSEMWQRALTPTIHGVAKVGVTLAKSAQGQGYAAEALAGLLDCLFFERSKHRVTAECDTQNASSIALLERLGIRREAHHLSSAWYKGEWTDEYVYAVLASDWTNRRSLTPAAPPVDHRERSLVVCFVPW